MATEAPAATTGELASLLRDYYRTATLWLPPRPTFRQFRLFLGVGSATRVVKIRDRIRNTDILRRWLTRFAPRHVYYTTATWLDSENLGPKELAPHAPGYPYAYNIFLSQELYFDIDVPGNIEEAKYWTRRLYQTLESEHGFQSLRIVYSGAKGFHVHVYDFALQDWVPDVPLDPGLRELATQEVKAALVRQLLARGLVFDADITLDTRRILRLPGTVHGQTLNICQFVGNLDTFRPQRLARE